MYLLPTEDVHIWSALQPESLPLNLETPLSSEECARARRFHFPEHGLAYIFAHLVLRDVLARYLRRPPGAISFRKNAFGKPFLDHAKEDNTLEFNLSHSGRLVVIGICAGRRIGVDIEQIRPIEETQSIAEAYFTSRECAFIVGQHPSARNHEFLRCWTRKEAYVKAVGKGFSIPLNSFDTLLESGPRSDDGATWQLTNLDLREGYVAAVAIETGAARLAHFEWQPGPQQDVCE